jgi:hypothetical protein
MPGLFSNACTTGVRIWEAHRLQAHRLRTFNPSSDPAFAEKIEDVVGLYMSPPCHAVVLSIEEKSQIQALDRTQPGLPLKPGKCVTMTHDYKRNRAPTFLKNYDEFFLTSGLTRGSERRHFLCRKSRLPRSSRAIDPALRFSARFAKR